MKRLHKPYTGIIKETAKNPEKIEYSQKMPKKSSKTVTPTVENECPVCIDTMVSPCKLPCGHIFCYECLDTILDIKPRCPLCRQDICIDDYKLQVDQKLYNILLKQNKDSVEEREKELIAEMKKNSHKVKIKF